MKSLFKASPFLLIKVKIGRIIRFKKVKDSFAKRPKEVSFEKLTQFAKKNNLGGFSWFIICF